MPLFSSPFVRLSFAPARSSFALLKTIVRPGRLILGKHLRCGQLLAYRSRDVRGIPPRSPNARDLGHPAASVIVAWPYAPQTTSAPVPVRGIDRRVLGERRLHLAAPQRNP